MAELLKKLSEIQGVSGNEQNIRQLIIDEISEYVSKIEIDSMGNVIAFKTGISHDKVLAVSAFMDEPGFIISSITEKGYLKFKPVGDTDSRKLISKRVVVCNKNIKGVIGMKAIHLQTRSERDNVTAADKLFIDIGAKNKSDAEKSVSLGDYVTFDTKFSLIGSNIKGKALDRSSGCYVLLNAIKKEQKYDTYFCFTVQHEVGSRGAQILAHRLNVNAMLSISSADTEDMYRCKDTNGCQLGKGVVLSCVDRNYVADSKMIDKIAVYAKKNKINMQICSMKNFRSDTGILQYGGLPQPVFSAAMPCRYSKSPVSIMSLSDINSCIEFTELFLNKIGDMV